MGNSFRLRFPIATVAAALALCASAQAAPVTVGSPLSGEFSAEPISVGSATLANLSLPESGADVSSPVNGAVVSWSVVATEGSAIGLRVLQRGGVASFLATGTSASESATGLSRHTFSTDIPIQAGDTIGLDIVHGDLYGAKATPGATAAAWVPAIPEGVATSYTASSANLEAAFNATVQPAPTISGIGPAAGSVKGGTAVTITGDDLEGASAVSFGSAPATSFNVSGEGSITATAPPSTTTAGVPVTVTTIAGTATSSATFTYQGCVVPKLAGKELKAAKKKLKAADCKLGKVTKKKGATAKSGKVGKQRPKAGKVLLPGSKVKLTLKP